MKIEVEYLSIGGNRHPSATDYDPATGILAFGAGHGVALWKPLNNDARGVYAILHGHNSDVNCVRFLNSSSDDKLFLLTGAADKTVRVWTQDAKQSGEFSCSAVLEAHTASVNCIACLLEEPSFASGAADGTVCVWTYTGGGQPLFDLVETIELKPKHFPLALALHTVSPGSTVLAVGGTRSSIQIYASSGAKARFVLACTLTGHEGWIRSLDIIRETPESQSDLLMASASQDKYIRIWRIHQGAELPKLALQDDGTRFGSVERSMSSKAQRFQIDNLEYTLSFEALLLGHEDWVYTAHWDKQSSQLRLLSASADSSLSLWEPEPVSGVWICNTRLGEISIQKGSTTATGSAGGFFSGLWIDGGKAVTCLGRTGSWRIWSQNYGDGPWTPALAVTGHIKDVKSVAWAQDGSYLLSTGSDQTTRVYAEWKRGTKRSWHEFARPQIHGYDLNCLDSINRQQFISGADEKLLRVFDEPSGTSVLLQQLTGADRTISEEAHDAASMPVLGLSNKAVEITDEMNGEMNGDITHQELAASTVPVLSIEHPPYEDDLARHTLWPEKEKLYGHGYEISAVCATNDGKIVATACKASSIDHAVIRLYETTTWRELAAPLKAHSLTVTSLRFSEDDQYLLSVGRDRQWSVFKQNANDLYLYEAFASDPRGHTRMILGAAWAPKSESYQLAFATAGRDKNIKIWSLTDGNTFESVLTLPGASSVTTVDFLPKVLNQRLLLASGTESGDLSLTVIYTEQWMCGSSMKLGAIFCSQLPISQVSWKKSDDAKDLLAVASEDNSVTIISVAHWVSS